MDKIDDRERSIDEEHRINPGDIQGMKKTEDGETVGNVKETTDDESRKEKEVVREIEENEDADSKTLNHAELKKVFEGALSQLLQGDPILSDLHPQVTLEEVNALIDLEHGRAMKIYIERVSGGYWTVVIPREATLHQLKQGLKYHVALVLNRKGVKKKISWHYIWKTYWLTFDGEKLTNDNSKLLEVGIKNKSTLSFVKKYRERQGKRHR